MKRALKVTITKMSSEESRDAIIMGFARLAERGLDGTTTRALPGGRPGGSASIQAIPNKEPCFGNEDFRVCREDHDLFSGSWVRGSDSTLVRMMSISYRESRGGSCRRGG